MDSDLVGSNGRTPEEERQYRAENRLPFRTTPPTPEERCRRTLKILEEDSELFQMLADAWLSNRPEATHQLRDEPWRALVSLEVSTGQADRGHP